MGKTLYKYDCDSVRYMVQAKQKHIMNDYILIISNKQLEYKLIH